MTGFEARLQETEELMFWKVPGAGLVIVYKHVKGTQKFKIEKVVVG